MRYMNTYEIEDAARRFRDHAILGPAVQTLTNLMNWTNENSDGWAYWPKPARAAARLMLLIEGDDPRSAVFDRKREDVTLAEYRKALAPIKSFRTRQGATFEIVEAR
jgi:hypothetical protein